METDKTTGAVKPLRLTLRPLAARIGEAIALAETLPDAIGYGHVKGDLNSTLRQVQYLLSLNRVEKQGCEPLDDKEEQFFDNLQKHLVKEKFLLTVDQFNSLTHEQKFSAARVMARNVPPEGVFLSDHLGLRFPHIYIGIEEDGYAHS